MEEGREREREGGGHTHAWILEGHDSLWGEKRVACSIATRTVSPSPSLQHKSPICISSCCCWYHSIKYRTSAYHPQKRKGEVCVGWVGRVAAIYTHSVLV